MRKATFKALVSASALVIGVKIAPADTNLFVTQADFGGSQYAPGGSQAALVSGGYQVVQNPNPVPAGQMKQTNYEGLGFYESSGTLAGLVGPSDSLGDPIVYANTSLGGANYTSNGLANLDNFNPPTTTSHTPDANLGTSWAGSTSPTGSMVITEFTGGYSITTSGEMINQSPGTGTESLGSQKFINALTTGTCLAYNITAPGGGTAASSSYFESTFETYDNNGGFNAGGAMQANPSATQLNEGSAKNINEYGTGSGLTIGNDDPGSFSILHGTGASSYWTVYIPYSFAANYASTLTYLQFAMEVNSGSCPEGNVTIDDIHTVSPTWAAQGSGLSWNTAGVVNYNESAPNGTASHGVLTTSPNWVGGPGGYGVPDGSGVSATFADLETGNASVGLDTTQTLGALNFNTLLYQYTLTPSSTGSSTSGSLVMDNTVNAADATINDTAGGQASTNYIEYVAVPVALNSNTDVTVTRSTDVLDITGNITGTGALSMAGAGTLQLYGSNTYSGGTTVTGGTLLVSSTGALPAGKRVSVTGATLEINNLATNSPTPPPPNMTITGLTMTGGALKLDSSDSGPFVQMNGSTVTMSSTVTLTGSLSISSTSVAIAGGTLQLGASVTAGSQSSNTPVTAPASNVTLSSLAISGNGTLDIGNNHIIINYGGGPDPIASIAAWIADGAYGSGTTVTWGGTGIISGAAASNPNYGIGYADHNDAGNPAGLSSGQIEIMYTLLGDANLDGKVNGSDFNLMATNFNQAVTAGWDKGDFNYDGKVNGNDFVLLAANFNQFASQSAISSADAAALDAFAAANGISLNSVPEPASMGLLAVGAISMLSRRRRKSCRS